ncbi:hypothetical protein QEN19_001330 [Hanseniaspora menglaensis]
MINKLDLIVVTTINIRGLQPVTIVFDLEIEDREYLNDCEVSTMINDSDSLIDSKTSENCFSKKSPKVELNTAEGQLLHGNAQALHAWDAAEIAISKTVPDDQLSTLDTEIHHFVCLYKTKDVCLIAAFLPHELFLKNNTTKLNSYLDFKPVKFKDDAKYAHSESKLVSIGLNDLLILNNVINNSAVFNNELQKGLYIFSGVSMQWIKIYKTDEYQDSWGSLLTLKQAAKLYGNFVSEEQQALQISPAEIIFSKFKGKYVNYQGVCYVDGIVDLGERKCIYSEHEWNSIAKLLDAIYLFNMHIFGEHFLLDYPLPNGHRKKTLTNFLRSPHFVGIYSCFDDKTNNNDEEYSKSTIDKFRRVVQKDLQAVVANFNKIMKLSESSGEDTSPPSAVIKWKTILSELSKFRNDYYRVEATDVVNTQAENILPKTISSGYTKSERYSTKIRVAEQKEPQFSNEQSFFSLASFLDEKDSDKNEITMSLEQKLQIVENKVEKLEAMFVSKIASIEKQVERELEEKLERKLERFMHNVTIQLQKYDLQIDRTAFEISIMKTDFKRLDETIDFKLNNIDSKINSNSESLHALKKK